MTQEKEIKFPDHVVAKVMDVVANISQYPDVPVLILVRGIPGAGKSTFAEFLNITFKTLGRKSFVFEADQYFMRDGEYKFNAADLHKAHYWCQKNAKQNMHSGQVVIVANTFKRQREMNEYIEDAQKKHVPIVLFSMQNSFGSIHNVPDETIKKMSERWAKIDREIVIDFSAVPEVVSEVQEAVAA
jgi:predicted kinase